MKPAKVFGIVVLLVSAAAAGAESEDALRRLIPTPKVCSLENGALPVVAQGKLELVILLPESADQKETLAANWVAKEIGTLFGRTPEIAAGLAGPAGGGKTQLVLASYNRQTENLKHVLDLLDPSDRELLADPARSEQAYVIRSGEGRIAVVGGSAQGTLYGAMTVLQLLQGGREDLGIPRVHVRDWPDFRYRVAENWTYTEGRVHWGRGWCYDWGDGAANYRTRVEAIFDRCLRYKINMICFSSGFGESFSRMWNADEFPLQKEFNRLADQRGIKLMIGGYGIGCDDPELRNRKSYPDGEEYLCLTTQNMGNCRSNEELVKRIQERLRQYVRKSEPRALYLHHEDSDTYASAEWLWKHRCGKCRERWPSDRMAAADGAAGAFAHGYNALCEAIFSVKNADSGYDASRDCLIFLLSPTYTAARESDAIWDKQLEYWRAVSRLLAHKKNVSIGIREQFLRSDNHRKRVLEMADMLRSEGGPGIFLFFVSNASIYSMGPLFVPVPAAMSKLNEGAETVYYMCGSVFQEPQILMNAAHMWNGDSLGACAVGRTASECLGTYNQYADRKKDPPGVFGEGGFLSVACQRLYGPEAGKPMEKFYTMKQFPLCYARELYIWGRRAGLYYDWTPERKTTQEAIGYVQAALEAGDCREENRAILQRLLKCLKLGEQFAGIRLAYRELVPLATAESATVEEIESRNQAIQRQIESMQRYLQDQFTFDWATPRGGDVGIWRSHVDQMRAELKGNVNSWTAVVGARDCAKRKAASGEKSLVVNGDMEEDQGWRFTAVTGEEEAGYADGGYGSDKAAGGRRSYRIQHRPATVMSDKWPMPQRTTWGEVEQKIGVKPGQTYVIVFNVFNNYGGASGYLEHQVCVDDKLMWAVDGSAPKGWKRGGLFVTAGSDTLRLRLRTTDVRPTLGWQGGEGDSWWDNVAIYAADAEEMTR